MNEPATVIVYPNIVSALGGAETVFNLIGESSADQEKRQAAQAARVAKQDAAAQARRMNSEPTLDMNTQTPAPGMTGLEIKTAIWRMTAEQNQPMNTHTPRPDTITNAHTGQAFPVTVHMPTQAAHGVTIDANTALVTVTFPAKPPRPVVVGLKEKGFRWNGQAWILTDPKNFSFDGPRFIVADGTTPAIQYALGVTGCPSHAYEAELARLKKELTQAQDSRGIRGMEDACGING